MRIEMDLAGNDWMSELDRRIWRGLRDTGWGDVDVDAEPVA